ncbi:MAG TPA: hypothetical protein VNT01_08870 [Symbiobacteriaceae bacterium]|nr:hypothetical protein [Symbiobacteriaceae bacterium]
MRTYYRPTLTLICTLAAFAGPIIFLEDRARLGYLAGGLVASLLTWALLAGALAIADTIPNWLQGVAGVGAALLSWAPISLVAVFDVIPHLASHGFNRFDPVWIGGGVASPLVVVGIALWRAERGWNGLTDAIMKAIFRYSVPLLGLALLARVPHLPKQYPWLFLFTGALFLTLDTLLDSTAVGR